MVANIKLSEALPWAEFRTYFFGVWSRSVFEAGRKLAQAWGRGDWASPESRAAASRRFKLERERVRRLCELVPLSSEDGAATARPSYHEEGRSLWLSRSARQEVLKLKKDPARVFFEKEKPFAKHLNKFFDDLPGGTTSLDLRDIFEEDREQLTRWHHGASLPFRGRISVTAGIDGTTISIPSRAASLMVDEPTFHNLPLVKVLPWWQERPLRTPLADEFVDRPTVFSVFAEELCEAIEERHGGIPLPPHVETQPATDETFEIIRLFPPSGDLNLSAFSERHRRRLEQPQKAVLIVLFTTATTEEARQALTEALAASGRVRPATCIIATPAEIEGHLTHAPWVWSRYLGRHLDYSIVDVSNQEAVVQALLRSPLLDVVPFDPVLSPGADHTHDGTADVLAVMGRPGAGKSCAITTLLSRRSGVAIVLSRDVSDDVWRILLGVGRAIESTHQPLTIVAEDIHAEILARPGHSTLELALMLARQFTPRPQVIVSFWSSEQTRLYDALGVVLARHDVDVLNIDHPPVAFWNRLVAYVFRVLDLPQEPPAVPNIAASFHDLGETPLNAVETMIAVAKSGTGVGRFRPPRGLGEYWRNRYRRLELDDRDAARLLQVLAFLRIAELRLNLRLVAGLFTKAFCLHESEFWDVLKRLDENCWVKIEETEILVDAGLLCVVQWAFVGAGAAVTSDLLRITAAAEDVSGVPEMRAARHNLHIAMFGMAAAAGERPLLLAAANLVGGERTAYEIWMSAFLNAIRFGKIESAERWLHAGSTLSRESEYKDRLLYMGLAYLNAIGLAEWSARLGSLIVREYGSDIAATIAVRLVSDLRRLDRGELADKLATQVVRQGSTYVRAVLDVINRAVAVAPEGSDVFDILIRLQSRNGFECWQRAFSELGVPVEFARRLTELRDGLPQ